MNKRKRIKKTKKISVSNQSLLFPVIKFPLLLIQTIGEVTLTFIKFTLKALEAIGQTTLIGILIIGKATRVYFKSVKKTFKRVVSFIQFIGEATILGAFATWVAIEFLLTHFGVISQGAKKGRLHNAKSYLAGSISNINLKQALNSTVEYFTSLTLPKPSFATSVALSAILILYGGFYIGFLRTLPQASDLTNKPLPQSSRVVDRNGDLLYIAYNGQINRVPIPLSSIPKHVKDATIAVEDHEFYSHQGFSIRGFSRAFINNLNDQPTQGGSTITQQLVKIALLKDNRKVISRKVKEAYLALMVEKKYSKDQILEMYLNNAPYGGTAYGIEVAARKYFGKNATELTLAEAALLSSLPSAPSIYSPFSASAEVYKGNQKRVLEKMQEYGFITQQQREEAQNQQLAFYSIDNQIYAPHFVFWVLDQLEGSYGKKLVQEGGLTIHTTLDLPTQLKAEQIVKENVEELEKPYWISNAAALVTEPKTGKIVAMVGSRDYFDETHDGQVNVALSKRQPGSSIKPINYAYALSYAGLNSGSVLSDSPVSYSNAWETYTPKNYDGKFRGNVTVRQALAMSLNIPAVKVLNMYGPDKMRELGIKMGIESWKDLQHYGLSLTLGAGEVKMTELATAYGTFTNLGKRVDLYAVEKIDKRDGKLLADLTNRQQKNIFSISQAQAAEDTNVIPEYTAYQITSILSDNAARMPAFGPYARLEVPGHKVAVKTGTTNNIRDNWTIGYTPDVLVATWVGNNDNSPMNPHLTSGITGAAPIWNEIMTGLIEDKPQEIYATPSGMIKVKICATNGLLTCARCPRETEEFFIPGTEPKTACSFPSVQDCTSKKSQLEKEGKSPDEIGKALVNCPAVASNP
ncbi:PBP1A family penicillin-binding protein [Candidatus Gottesmanbacteria bacterium]|nr:PBP1A family penicillin-binding protein [Candidatus Gottesmanbacteria bacterium]